LELDVIATAPTESGAENNYSLVLDYLQTQITLTQEQTEGLNVQFDVSMLNENFQYTGKLYDSNGDLVTIEDSPNSYDCIKFKTVMNVISY
jgi:hypothetical protein